MQEATKTPTAMPTICPVLKEDGSVVALASVVAKAAAVIPISTDSEGSDDSSGTVFMTNVFTLASFPDSGYSAVQTSQNRSRMSEATPPLPPLPPLPHCVAVGKYRQKV